MPTLVTVAPDMPMLEMAEILARDGALIIRDLLNPDEVAQVYSELEPYVEATAPRGQDFSGLRTTRTGALVARSQACREMVMDPRILGLCDHFLLPNCTQYQLHISQLMRIMPGQPAQEMHRDRWCWSWLKGIEPEVQAIWALTDFTKENGATRVVPGSLDWPDDRVATEDEIAYAEMKAGSALVYNGTVYHSGGANVSNVDRWGLMLSYSLGWLRQEENQYLSCPPEIASKFGPELGKILGYAPDQFGLGRYTPPRAAGEGPDLVDPLYALEQASGAWVDGFEKVDASLLQPA